MAADPYKYFRHEARDLLEQLGKGVMQLEREGSAALVVPKLLRFAHTLKGAARVVKQPAIADLAHSMEDLLTPFREGRTTVPREPLDAILRLVDEIGARVRALTPPEVGPASSPQESLRIVRTEIAEMDALLDGIAETQARLAAARRTAASIGQAVRLAGVVADQLARPARTGQRTADGGSAETAAQDLRALVAGIERGLAGDVERVDRELQQVRRAGERLRLVPVSMLFGSLERAVRDSARALGKQATFRGEGAEIRLDGHVLGALQDALVQGVRNAVAHGIEAEADRRAAGKPLAGSVVVEVRRRGNSVAVECRDDGRGIDISAVRRALQRKGTLREADEGIAPETLLHMLLESGISTSAEVTGMSGRGVGLDVVREAMSRLGGQAGLQTHPGKGTTLELLVPVSLSSLEALVVEAAGVTASIPLEAVRRTIRVERDAVAKSSDGESVLYEGVLIPFVPLAHALRNDAAPSHARRTRAAVVVGSGPGIAAFGVERLLGRATLLVRPLPPLAAFDAVVSGLSLDADGNPQAVLDPGRLVEAARGIPPAAALQPAPAQPILIVDDSLTTRMLEQSILESAGYAVDSATSGEEALEKARQRSYALLLVDVEMPGMDGFSLLEHLRADPALRGIPALLVTSRSSPEDRKRGIEAGARAYIVKSEFDQAELLEWIRRLIG